MNNSEVDCLDLFICLGCELAQSAYAVLCLCHIIAPHFSIDALIVSVLVNI